MYLITICLVIFFTVSECYIEATESSRNEELEGISEGPSSVYGIIGSQRYYPGQSWPPWRWDWRENGGIIPVVKDQGACDAGWAFSVVAAVESHKQIHNNVIKRLSEQFLIDCIEGADGTHGCSNKYHTTVQENTYAQLITKFPLVRGIVYYEYYRDYSANQTTCDDFVNPPYARVSGFRKLDTDFFEQKMVHHLVTKGPLVAAINSKAMMNYTGGIDDPTEDECDRSENSSDHFVLIVGYDWKEERDTKSYSPYWIIKNSKGPNWGENGYYYLVRGKNACGIGNDLSIPFVDDVN